MSDFDPDKRIKLFRFTGRFAFRTFPARQGRLRTAWMYLRCAFCALFYGEVEVHYRGSELDLMAPGDEHSGEAHVERVTKE